jgi:hypothetical protein
LNTEKIDELNKLTKGCLPKEYLEFLLRGEGFEGDLPIMPYYAILYDASEVIDGINGIGYEVPPGFIMIGTSGGGEQILLDMRQDPPCVASLPAIGGDLECLYLLAHSISEFIEILGKDSDEASKDIDERREKIPRHAWVALDAQFWTKEEIPHKVKLLELNKYASEFSPIAQSGTSHFIGIRKNDGSIWQVPCLGTEHLQADKIADSLQHLNELIAEMKTIKKNDNWRYYEEV